MTFFRWMIETPLAWLFERLGNRFYVGLAVLLALVFAAAIAFGVMSGMQNQAYDLIMKSRFNVPRPNPDVVLVDIDEASLAAMAPLHGRWPWPRSVMAEFVEYLAQGEPQAIVFDITFIDPDLDHADADAYLREVVGSTPNTFFTMIRLNPDNDSLSELKLSTLAGVHPVDEAASPAATVAMIVPYFYADLAGDRLGTNNLYSGSDGIARQYQLYRDVSGWRIGSLPANVVAAAGRALPASSDVLLNWRGAPGAYPTWSFAPLYAELSGEKSRIAAAPFKGKIVIIGSTAPSLFDLKPTPMSQNHPGLEILATAIDNLYTGDALRQLPSWLYVLITVSLLALLSIAFVSNVDYRLLNPVFTLVQFSFLAISYLFLNYSSIFVDLSAPFAAGLIYFSIARTYSMGLNLRRNGHPFFSMALQTGSHSQVLMIRCQMTGSKSAMRRTRTLLLQRVGLTALGVSAPRMFNQSPLLSTIYSDTLVLYWIVPVNQTSEALEDLYQMLTSTFEVLGERHAICHFWLDAFELTVEGEDDWRMAGKTALAKALAASQVTDAVIETSPSFEKLSQSEGEVLPFGALGK